MPGSWDGVRETMFKEVADSIATKRIAKLEGIAQTVLHLMSHGNTTECTLYVNGEAPLR
ncbi:MAG TPA: hypothetical protein VLK23_15615 [Thermodesulfobacteriota bacterium]|nr:hypothetical protein [Thermodesulfobacteriota bacterium]